MGTLEIMHMELLHETLAPEEHVAFKLVTHAPALCKSCTLRAELSPELGGGSIWMAGWTAGYTAARTTPMEKKPLTALPATWDSCLDSSKWSGAKCGPGRSSEGNPEQMPKDTSPRNGKATTQTQLSAFEVNTFSLIPGR